MKRQDKIILIYRKLYKLFGRQRWWPADTPFEVMVGAILTQNASWKNVEKAIGNLKKEKVLTPEKLLKLKQSKLRRLIRPSGFYTVKARRLTNFLTFLSGKYNNNIGLLRDKGLYQLRKELLAVSGVGKETADSMLLYALGKTIFVVDAYTKRILSRHGIVGKDIGYDGLQHVFMSALPRSVKLYNEYHALLVRVGKDYCKAGKPLCEQCPLAGL